MDPALCQFNGGRNEAHVIPHVGEHSLEGFTIKSLGLKPQDAIQEVLDSDLLSHWLMDPDTLEHTKPTCFIP